MEQYSDFKSLKIHQYVNELFTSAVMQVFHWSRPCNRTNRPYESRVGCESRRVVGKRAQKC